MSILQPQSKQIPHHLSRGDRAVFGDKNLGLPFGLERSEVQKFMRLVSKRDLRPSTQTSARDSSQKDFFSSAQVRTVFESHGFTYPETPRRIGMLMCKGGVGKTTISYFLSLRLASYGARVLVIDSDAQANLTMSLLSLSTGFALNERTPVLVDVLTDRANIRDAIIPVDPFLHLLPSTAVNSLLECELLSLKKNPIARLNLVLNSLGKDYDYILVDCAPSLNIFNASVAFACNDIVIPFQLNEFSRLGLRQTVTEIGDLQKRYLFNSSMRLLLNAYRGVDTNEQTCLAQIMGAHRDLVMDSVIRQSSEIQAQLSTGKDFFRTLRSQARTDFNKLAVEVLTGFGDQSV